MIRFMLLILGVCANAFAYEGAADRLAGGVLSFLGYVLGCVLVAAVWAAVTVVPKYLLVMYFGAWNKFTLAGKIVFYVLPLSIVSMGVFYFIFYSVVPLIVKYPYLSLGIGLSLYWMSTALTGYKIEGERGSFIKRPGKYAVWSRVFVMFPVLPLIIVGWSLYAGCGKLCINGFKCKPLFSIWQYN